MGQARPFDIADQIADNRGDNLPVKGRFMDKHCGTSPRDLRTLLDCVIDERSFIEYLRALAGEWSARHESGVFSTLPTDPASNWENASIGAFLDAAVRWADASRDGLRFYDVPTNPWRRMAEIMRAGKEYE